MKLTHESYDSAVIEETLDEIYLGDCGGNEDQQFDSSQT
jgi:hypothetical protein